MAAPGRFDRLGAVQYQVSGEVADHGAHAVCQIAPCKLDAARRQLETAGDVPSFDRREESADGDRGHALAA
jgi:hypothetical protein